MVGLAHFLHKGLSIMNFFAAFCHAEPYPRSAVLLRAVVNSVFFGLGAVISVFVIAIRLV